LPPESISVKPCRNEEREVTLRGISQGGTQSSREYTKTYYDERKEGKKRVRVVPPSTAKRGRGLKGNKAKRVLQRIPQEMILKKETPTQAPSEGKSEKGNVRRSVQTGP